VDAATLLCDDAAVDEAGVEMEITGMMGLVGLKSWCDVSNFTLKSSRNCSGQLTVTHLQCCAGIA
jgi:hypothetical protein